MRTVRLPALAVLIALALLASCRDAGETLIGAPEEASLAESEFYDRRGAALDMNNSSVAVGWVNNPAKQPRAFRWPAGGNVEVLGTLGGDMSRAMFINDAGQIAGVSRTADGLMHVFLWTAARGMEDLGTLSGSEITLTGFSSAGHVVGWGVLYNGETLGFVARAGSPLRLIPGYPTDVNGAGVVVGRMGPGASRPFMWTSSRGVQPLPPPWGDWSWGSPVLNEAGTVAGAVSQYSYSTYIVRWTPSGGYETSWNGCGVYGWKCVDPVVINEHGAVAWSIVRWYPSTPTAPRGLKVWEPNGTVRETPVSVEPSRLFLNHDGKVAGGGATPTGVRSFLWRRSLGVTYYRTASMVYALNDVGNLAGATVIGWKERPARFALPENSSPVANAGGPYEVLAGVPLTVNADLSSDPDGDSLRVYWGGFHDPLCCWRRRPPVGWRATATYQWNIPGEYTISLSVADPDSLYSNATAQVRVLPNPGAAMRYGPYVADPGQKIKFDGRRADDPTGLRYRYHWSFDNHAPRAIVSRVFPTPDVYDISLQIRDSAGALVEMVQTRVETGPDIEFITPPSLGDGPYEIGFEWAEDFDYSNLQFSFSCGGDEYYSAWSTQQYHGCWHTHTIGPSIIMMRGRAKDLRTGKITEYAQEVPAHYPFCNPDSDDCLW